LIDPDDDELKNIEDYIDYQDFKFSGSKVPTTVKEYIQCIMKSRSNLDRYLVQYPQMKTVNKNLTQYSLNDIDVDNYSIGITGFKAPFGAVFVHKEYPTDCSIPATFKPHHQFVVQDNRVSSRFLWDTPPSATEFELQIQKENKAWEDRPTVYLIPRSYNHDHKQPNGKITFEDASTPYDISSTYKARFRLKCGVTSAWSAYSDSVKFTYVREKYQVSATSITATRVPGSTTSYIIKWDEVNGASGYYIEYADENEGLANARQRLSPGPGKTNPFDVLRVVTSFVYTSTSGSFLFKVTPQCNGMRGLETVKAFNFSDNTPTSCPPINEDGDVINYYFNSQDQLTLEWDSDYLHDQYQLKIIEKGQAWDKPYYVKTLPRLKGNGVVSPQHVISDKQFYAGTTYIVRAFAKCVAISRAWADAYLELEFEGTSVRPINIKAASMSNHGTINSSGLFDVKRSAEIGSDINTSATLLVHPNPIWGDEIQFSVKNAPFGNAQIDLINALTGKQESSEKRIISSAHEVLSVQKDLNAGYYILTVTLHDGNVLQQKFEKGELNLAP
jgi:hypothetical protein